VLPLENLSGDPEQEYFADGLTEALITTLAKIRALRVVSRTTVMHYKGVHRPLPQIASELGVDAVVEGTVLRSGERVRISAQLIDARTDAHLWAESYDRDLRDVLALHSELARAIATEIQVNLTPEERQKLTVARPVDVRAYEAYLKARFHWNKLTPDGLKKAIGHFQDAIAKDPTYSAAYSGLADCSSRLGFWGFASPEQGYGAAKAAAQKAVELDPALAEAHASLAWAIMHYDWDCIAAEKEFRHAVELNPNYTSLPHFHAVCLAVMGCEDESVAEMKRVLSLDPLSLVGNMTATAIFWILRRFDDAVELGRRTLELDPCFAPTHWALGFAYGDSGRYDAARAELENAIQISNGEAVHMAVLGYVHAKAGKRDEALRIVAELTGLSKQRYIMPLWLAMIYAPLNERDLAFQWLEEAYRDRSSWMVYSERAMWLDNLRSDPRFEDLRRRIKSVS
jgi:TolB-like protein